MRYEVFIHNRYPKQREGSNEKKDIDGCPISLTWSV